jgi:hypothetical protein
MKVILKRLSDNKYFAGSRRWTISSGQAFDFEVITRAVQFLKEKELANAQIILSFPNSIYDQRLELKLSPTENILEIKQPPGQPRVKSKLPKPYKDVLIITKNSRYLGYLDDRGVWHAVRGNLSEDVIGWEPI